MSGMGMFLGSRTGVIQPPKVIPRTSYGTPKPSTQTNAKPMAGEKGPNLKAPQSKKAYLESGGVMEATPALPGFPQTNKGDEA